MPSSQDQYPAVLSLTERATPDLGQRRCDGALLERHEPSHGQH